MNVYTRIRQLSLGFGLANIEKVPHTVSSLSFHHHVHVSWAIVSSTVTSRPACLSKMSPQLVYGFLYASPGISIPQLPPSFLLPRPPSCWTQQDEDHVIIN